MFSSSIGAFSSADVCSGVSLIDASVSAVVSEAAFVVTSVVTPSSIPLASATASPSVVESPPAVVSDSVLSTISVLSSVGVSTEGNNIFMSSSALLIISPPKQLCSFWILLTRDSTAFSPFSISLFAYAKSI